MTKESWLNFIGIGWLVLPAWLGIGTGSLDVVAMSLLALLFAQMAILLINPDDPIGDKLKAEAREKDDLPQ